MKICKFDNAKFVIPASEPRSKKSMIYAALSGFRVKLRRRQGYAGYVGMTKCSVASVLVSKARKFHKFKSVVIFFLATLIFSSNAYDVNIIGHIAPASSLSRHATSFIECLSPDIPIKFFKTSYSPLTGTSSVVDEVLARGVPLCVKSATPQQPVGYKPLTGISIYTDSFLWYAWDQYKKISTGSTLRFAYCVTERTEVVPRWIERLNKDFDAIIIPDQWGIDSFKNSGLTIPIFVLPLALQLDPFFNHVRREKRSKPFSFGYSGAWWNRKNHTILMQAFAQEFGNNPDVVLKVHGRRFKDDGAEKVLEACKRLNVSNIDVIQKTFSIGEYQNFIMSLDCYVSVSKGEGFSITPREALAAGIPCIITDNTAQKTICDSGCVYAVPAEIKEPSFLVLTGERAGFDFNCRIEDVRLALRTVYEKYQVYCERADIGRVWVQQYVSENLRTQYRTLVQPQTVLLSDGNEIGKGYIKTNSKTLFEKYKKLCGTRAKFIK